VIDESRIPNPESRILGAAMIRSGVAGTSRTSIPMLLIAFTTAGATPSNGISPTPFAP
jgi:hypothetical protein